MISGSGFKCARQTQNTYVSHTDDATAAYSDPCNNCRNKYQTECPLSNVTSTGTMSGFASNSSAVAFDAIDKLTSVKKHRGCFTKSPYRAIQSRSASKQQRQARKKQRGR
jgi:hypothetical protein